MEDPSASIILGMRHLPCQPLTCTLRLACSLLSLFFGEKTKLCLFYINDLQQFPPHLFIL